MTTPTNTFTPTERSLRLSPWQRLLALIQPDAPLIAKVYGYALVSGLLTLSLPLGLQAIVNLIMGGQLNSSWLILSGFVIAGIASTGVLQIS